MSILTVQQSGVLLSVIVFVGMQNVFIIMMRVVKLSDVAPRLGLVPRQVRIKVNLSYPYDATPLGIGTLSITKLSIMKLSIMTFSMMTFSIMTPSKVKLSKMSYIATPS